MECPHVNDGVRICAVPSTPQRCAVCDTHENPWLCLTCGIINCGRYVQGHGLEHYSASQQEHHVCMDCDSLAVFCYQCDEFVVNDSPLLDDVRRHLNAHKEAVSDETKEDSNNTEDLEENEVVVLEENLSNHVDNKECLTDEIVVEPDTSVCVENNCTNKENEQLGITFEDTNDVSKENLENEMATTSRRRKSTESSQSRRKKLKISNDEKVKIKPKSSGLRNLGNTCFMNAVLQSLSNIHSFCGYIKQLPSLENKVAKKKTQTRAQVRKDGDQVFLIEELRKTLIAIWQREKASISPESLFSVIWKVVPRFRGYQQQDAHEFMRYLLDRLHTELLTLLPYPNNDSIYIGPKKKKVPTATLR